MKISKSLLFDIKAFLLLIYTTRKHRRYRKHRKNRR
nr:MAG TPA: hypothetical protein [Caudoviricetes sp.]